ncbi:hypothetical protein CEXT_330851 [Caerostris extrusa]|uniref:Uncharacterized protein n=1 Tax=Caerostris extrusa TaxID=172846 RepID=A0AAV4WU01_CAEEX|nr:hypothetical protein CEXT_330851 [Caerostris extrusa]
MSKESEMEKDGLLFASALSGESFFPRSDSRFVGKSEGLEEARFFMRALMSRKTPIKGTRFRIKRESTLFSFDKRKVVKSAHKNQHSFVVLIDTQRRISAYE